MILADVDTVEVSLTLARVTCPLARNCGPTEKSLTDGYVRAGAAASPGPGLSWAWGSGRKAAGAQALFRPLRGCPTAQRLP